MPTTTPIRLGLLAVAICLAADAPPKSLHDDFEGPKPSFRREMTDANVTIHAHERSNRSAHDGQKAERFRFSAGPGSALYYSYPLPRIPIAAEPTARLFVRGNQEGVQILGRVVLPGDVDPETKEPSFVLVPGARYDAPDRWQRLELGDLPLQVERQARVLRATTKRKVPLDGAYLERLVVNVFGNPGESDIFLDDLTISPVPEDAVLPTSPSEADVPAPSEGPGAEALPVKPKAELRLEANHILRDGRPWIFTMVRAPKADPRVLYPAGFQVFDAPAGTDPEEIRKAVKAGLLLMPGLALETAGEPREPEEVAGEAAAYPFLPSVAFWDLGRHLGSEGDADSRRDRLERVRAVGLKLHKLAGNAPKITTGEVEGLFTDYSRKVKGGLDVVGVGPNAWGSAMEPLDGLRYLSQRRDLTAKSSPQATFWAWVRATPPSEVRDAAWGSHTPPAYGAPRVQPEQVRMNTYQALMAGYRGIGFEADSELTRPSGRAMLNEMAFLNAEIGLIEPLLAQAVEPIPILLTYPPDPPKVIAPQGIGNSSALRGGARNPNAPPNAIAPPETGPHPTIRVASFTTVDQKGQLLLLADCGFGAQWQPGQMALNNLTIRIQAPESAQAFQVSLGGVEWLKTERVPGGKNIIIPEFGNTAIVVVTTDFSLYGRFEAQVKALRSRAILLALEQAQLQYDQVEEIHRRLVDDGHDPKNSSAVGLLQKCKDSIKSADEALQREDYPLAWAEARRATRPLRILMRAHFDDAFFQMLDITGQLYGEDPRPKPGEKPKDPPKVPKPKGPYPPTMVQAVSSPPLVAFNMLPRQYLWNDWIRRYKFGRNEIKGGDFEAKDPLSVPGWKVEEYPIDGVIGTVKKLPGGWKGGKQTLRFNVRPTNGTNIDTLTPFLDQMPVSVVSPPVRVHADEIVRISVNVLSIRPINPGGGGVIIRPSIGGETLQFRTTNAIPDWVRVVLYRQAPADCDLTVTMGLAGYGDVFFDELRVERLTDPSAEGPGGANLAGRSRRRPDPGIDAEPNPPAPRPSAAVRPEPAGRTTR